MGLDIGDVGDLSLIHANGLQRTLCEALALVFAAFWLGFDVAQSIEQAVVAPSHRRTASFDVTAVQAGAWSRSDACGTDDAMDSPGATGFITRYLLKPGSTISAS